MPVRSWVPRLSPKLQRNSQVMMANVRIRREGGHAASREQCLQRPSNEAGPDCDLI